MIALARHIEGRPVLLVALLCLTQTCAMAGFATYWSALPVLQPAWELTNTQAGWISGILFGGFCLAVPFLVSVTDHRDARGIVLIGCGLTALGLVGMAVAADGFWSAMAWRAVAGAGLAGTYMPGLKILTDRLAPGHLPRAVAFYTSSFSVGSGTSFALSGMILGMVDWQWTFALVALGPVIGGLAIWFLVRPRQPDQGAQPRRHAFDLRPVLRAPQTMAYVLAYAGHTAELFAMRSWLVPFLVVSMGFSGMTGEIDAAFVAMAVSFIAVASSITGAELAIRFGRVRLISVVMVISALTACATGFSITLPFWLVVSLCLVYAATIQADSSAITAGAIAMAPEGHRGATMAVHSVIGFSGALFGPMMAGAVLDVSGGQTSVLAWGLTYSLIGSFGLIGLACLLLLGRHARG